MLLGSKTARFTGLKIGKTLEWAIFKSLLVKNYKGPKAFILSTAGKVAGDVLIVAISPSDSV